MVVRLERYCQFYEYDYENQALQYDEYEIFPVRDRYDSKNLLA